MTAAPTPWVLLAGAPAFLAFGVLAAGQPTLAVAVLAAAVGVAVLAVWSEEPIALLFAGAILVVSGLVDAPRRLGVGPLTGLALLTAGLALASIPFWLNRGAGRSAVPAALFGLVAWIAATAPLHPPSAAGVQNLLVLAVFLSALVMAATAPDGLPAVLERVMPVAALTAFALYALTLATHGLGGIGVVSPRPFALFALVVLAWYLPRLRRSADRLQAWLFAGASLALIVASLSRGAFLAAVAMIGLNGLLAPHGHFFKRAVAVVLAVGLAAATITYVRPLHDRFAEGDVRAVSGGVTVNVEGRFEIWKAVWKSFETSPLVGQGAGSSDDLTDERFTGVDHPHSDYLRLLHDYGVPGLVLWALAFGGLLRGALHAHRIASTRRGPASVEWLPAAAILGLATVAMTMATDNPLIYLYVLAPVGVFVGAALGLLRRSRAAGQPALPRPF